MRKERQTLSDTQEEILKEIEKYWMGVADRRMLSRMSLRIPRSSAIVLEKVLRVYPEITLPELLERAEAFTGRNLDEHRGATSGHHILSSEKTMGELASRAKITQEFNAMVEESINSARKNSLGDFWLASIRQRRKRNLPLTSRILIAEARESGNLIGMEEQEKTGELETLIQQLLSRSDI